MGAGVLWSALAMSRPPPRAVRTEARLQDCGRIRGMPGPHWPRSTIDGGSDRVPPRTGLLQHGRKLGDKLTSWSPQASEAASFSSSRCGARRASASRKALTQQLEPASRFVVEARQRRSRTAMPQILERAGWISALRQRKRAGCPVARPTNRPRDAAGRSALATSSQKYSSVSLIASNIPSGRQILWPGSRAQEGRFRKLPRMLGSNPASFPGCQGRTIGIKLTQLGL